MGIARGPSSHLCALAKPPGKPGDSHMQPYCTTTLSPRFALLRLRDGTRLLHLANGFLGTSSASERQCSISGVEELQDPLPGVAKLVYLSHNELRDDVSCTAYRIDYYSVIK